MLKKLTNKKKECEMSIRERIARADCSQTCRLGCKPTGSQTSNEHIHKIMN